MLARCPANRFGGRLRVTLKMWVEIGGDAPEEIKRKLEFQTAQWAKQLEAQLVEKFSEIQALHPDLKISFPVEG